jgi:N-acetylmuramidase/LysM domain
MSTVHTVVKGDTLGKISKTSGVSIIELKNINHLSDPNKLAIGQKISLKKETILGFQALILDRDRNPINGLGYQFEFAGRMTKGATGIDGLTKKIMTVSPEDQIRILVERMDKSLKEVAIVASGYGNKLVTLMSPSIKVEARTEPHPNLKPGELPNKKEKVKPIHNPEAKQPATTNKQDLGVKATPTKTVDGKPLTKVEGDIPDLSFLDENPDLRPLTENDFSNAAEKLGVSIAQIKTVTEVEAKGKFFWDVAKIKRHVPPILFERHKFSMHSGRKFDALYPDISSRKPGGYIGKFPEYKRLAKAVQLDREAALKSASWGAFQIMGSHYSALGFSTAEDFVRFLSHSEKNQLEIFVKACVKVNPIWKKSLQEKDWVTFARAYNGADYKINKYDEKLKAEFEKLSKIK